MEPSADGPASVPRPTAPDPDRDSDPAPPEPTAQSGSFIHGLIGLSPGGFSETVRNSISSLTKRDHDAVTITTQITAQSPPQVGADMALKLEGDNIRPISPPPQKPQPRHLLALPPEMLFMILQRLDFADIVRLRKTCKQLHDLANPQQIRILFGPAQLRMQLLGHCKTCLLYDPFRSRLLQPCMVDPGYPLASRCLDCAVKGHDPRIRVGKKINLANFDTVWVCRWCGYPIVEGAAFGCEQFHRFCYVRYNDLLVGFFVLGWLQLGLGIVAAALAWKYYRNSLLVFAPTVVSTTTQQCAPDAVLARGRASAVLTPLPDQLYPPLDMPGFSRIQGKRVEDVPYHPGPRTDHFGTLDPARLPHCHRDRELVGQ